MAKPRRLAAFLAVSFFYWISQYLYVPTLPEYIRQRTASLVAVGVILSMYGLWQAIVRLPLGIAVDKTRRGKAFLILGFLLGAGGALVLAFGRGAGALTIGRSLSGVAAGSWVPLIVVFSTLFPPKEAVVAASLLTFSGSLGRAVATSLNGWLNAIGGYTLAFYLAAASAAACAIIIAVVKAERPDVREVSARSITRIFLRSDVILPSIISAMLQLGNWAVIFGFMPILAAQMGADQVTQSLLIGLNIAADMTGNLVVTRLPPRTRRIGLLYVASLVFSSGIALYAVSGSVGWFFVASALMGAGNGLSYPTLMGLSIERVDRSHRTTAMGVHQSVYSLGMFGGPWIGGILAQALGIRWMFGITAVACILASYPLIHLRAGIERQLRHGDSPAT